MRVPRPRELCALVAGLFVSLGSAGGRADLRDVPPWVPEQYRSYFVHYVDDRSTLERALNRIAGWTLQDTGRSFALVAGISRYPRMQGRAATLEPAADDVAKLVAYLKEYEFFNEIVVLENQDVTPENLRYYLTNYFPRRLQQAPKSRFLFAYSGHGMTESNRGFILTTEATSLEDRYEAISMGVLRAMFQDVVDSGYQVLALINACYGGNFLNMSFGDRDYPPQREGAHAITAGRSGELTWHDPEFGGGTGSLFFEAILAGLDGRADHLPEDGLVTMKELDTYLSSTISYFTRNQQNPQSGDLIPEQSPGGFFFFDRRRQVEARITEPFDHATAVAFGRSLIEGTKPASRVQPAVGIHDQDPPYEPGDEFRDCEDCPLMVVVPAGSFTMGSTEGDEDERPPHLVEVPTFAIGKHEVTFDEWDACVAAGKCNGYEPDDRWGRGRQPVIHVSWYDAKAYVEWLSGVTSKEYRLPSEAEWEYAARAGSDKAYWWGDDPPTPERANFRSSGTTETGAYPANPRGLHDMNGNVWEWTEDCWHDGYGNPGRPDDGSAWTTGDCSHRVLRGGSWISYPEDLRSASRFRYNSDYRGGIFGFRVARTLSQSESVTP